MLFRQAVTDARRARAMADSREVVSIQDRRLIEMLGLSVDGEVDVTGANALKEATVYACIRILSEAIAKLPLKIYRDDNGATKATGHELYSLLKLRPNPLMSTSDFLRVMEVQRNLYGNAYANIECYTRGPQKGHIRALWPMDASRVKLYVDERGILSSNHNIVYVVNVDSEERRLKPEEVLHVKHMTLNGLIGIPPIERLKTLVQSAAQGADYINRFFKQGLQAKGLIQYVGDLSPDAEKVFKEHFEQMSSGLTNAHRIALMPIGYRFEPFALSLVDAQFIENSQLTIRQIAAAFGIKPHQLNELERSSYASLSEQQRQFYVDTMMAILTAYEQELTYKLFLAPELEQGYYVKFQVDALTRADIKTRYEAYRQGLQGFLTPNEVRAWEELPAKPDGDVLLVNKAMAALTNVVRGDGGDSDEEP